jgi:hypothetical protein
MKAKVIMLVLALVAAGAVALVVTRPWQAPGAEDPMPPAMREVLTGRVVSVLEDEPAGRRVMARGAEPVACAARVIGAEPSAVPIATEARTVYAWVICRVISDGQPTSSASLPVAVHFGPPIAVEEPDDGAGYTSSVRRIFPRRLHDVVFDGENRYVAELQPKIETRAREVAAR